MSRVKKVLRVLNYYFRLICYTAKAKPAIFHILWNNKIEIFDRTLLMLYYKLLGKRLILTVHNVDKSKRDGGQSFLNRFSLRWQYRLSDHIFVHTEKMKTELVTEFGVAKEKVSVIPFGINNTVPNTSLSTADAKQQLGIIKMRRLCCSSGISRLTRAWNISCLLSPNCRRNAPPIAS